MKPLICPQCGGKIVDYKLNDIFTVCNYCGTKFVIEHEIPKPVFTPAYEYKPVSSSFTSGQIVGTIMILAAIVIGGIIFLSVISNKNTEPEKPLDGYTKPTPTNTPPISPTPTPNLLEFGGKGTGEGLFQDADSLAVDSKGRIYVGDETLRVQQFDENGKFLKLWQVPSQTENYKRARTINKIAVDNDENLYVAVGGVILIYKQDSSEPFFTLHNAPDYVTDFALRSDGGLILTSTDDDIETLFFVNKNKKVTRNVKGFHSDTADASMSPFGVGLSAIRVAVDGANNIYSIYALGDLGSYSLSYNAEDFRIFRFNAEGKYINKFVQTLNSVGIEVDNQSRIYISDQSAIEIYSGEGVLVSTVSVSGSPDAFALDKQNNIYILIDNRIIKRPAV